MWFYSKTEFSIKNWLSLNCWHLLFQFYYCLFTLNIYLMSSVIVWAKQLCKGIYRHLIRFNYLLYLLFFTKQELCYRLFQWYNQIFNSFIRNSTFTYFFVYLLRSRSLILEKTSLKWAEPLFVMRLLYRWDRMLTEIHLNN